MANEEYKRAQEQVQSLKGFYANLISYAAVNFVLIVVNAITTPGEWWFYWVTIFWGIGLIFHALDVFTLRGKYLSKEWEERKIQEVMDKDRKRKAG